MVSSRTFALTVAVLASMAFGAATAEADQRYAAVTGTNVDPCTLANPCDIETAVNSAAANDEVIINSGTYTLGLTGSIATNGGPNIYFHGAVGQARPVITGSATNLVNAASAGSHASDLIIEQTGNVTNGAALAVGGPGSVAERIEAHSTGIHACAINDGGLLRDSTCIEDNVNNGSALFSATGATSNTSARNVTAIGLGPNSFGVRALAGSSAVMNLDLRNVIASGTAADIEPETSNAAAKSTIDVAYSNYDSVATLGLGTNTVTPVGSPTNQTAAPIFVNAGAGDYRQATGSPTIDAGAADGFTGALDVLGELRPQGTSIDIGADEFTAVPPPPPPDTTAPETSIAKGPKAKTKSKNATFTFSADETSTFQCKLDKAAFAPCTSPKKYKRLKKGKHTFSVQATDASANLDATPAIYKWTVKKKQHRKR